MGKQVDRWMGRQGYWKTGSQVDWYTLYSYIGKQVSRWNGKKGHVKKVDSDMAKQVDRWRGRP